MGVSLGIPQGDVHKILIYHKQQIFSYRTKGAVRLKSLLIKIGPNIDLVCPTSSFFTNIVIESSWMGAIRRPCSIRRGGPKLLCARLSVVDSFGIQLSSKYIAKTTDTDLRFNEIWGSITSTMLSSTMNLVLSSILNVEYCVFSEDIGV